MSDDNTNLFEDEDVLEAETELTPPELYAANLIEWALERHASDLFVSDSDTCVMVMVRQMGRIQVIRRLAKAYGRRLQGHLRVLAGADAGEIVRPVEGRGVITTPDGLIADLRLSCMPTLFGQDVAIRLFHPVHGARKLHNLGLDAHDLELVNSLATRSSGLILLAGPVASGKSSTLYAMLDLLNDGTRKIHTIEDPIEHSLAGIMQSQVNEKAHLGFAELLSAVLRHSPDVIMIGEIRDQKTAETAVRAGASGQLVLATVHAKSSAEAIDMMLQYDANRKFLAGALIGVINQRLIRRLCSQCRVDLELGDRIEVSDRIRERLQGEPPRLYRAAGCSACHDVGFDSLVSLPEIMCVDDVLSAAIKEDMSSAKLEALATERGMLSLAESAILQVVQGVTSPQEAGRTVSDPELTRLISLSLM